MTLLEAIKKQLRRLKRDPGADPWLGILTITPKDVKEVWGWAGADKGQFAGQRDHKPIKCDAFVDLIKRGMFTLNGDTIVFDEEGQNTNGANRLRAIVKANKPIRSAVCIGVKRIQQNGHVPINVMDSYDDLTARSFSDQLKLRGVSYATAKGALTTRVNQFMRNGFGQYGSGHGNSNVALMRVFEEDPTIESAVEEAIQLQSGYKGVLTGSTFHFMWWLLHKIDHEQAATFLHTLAYGKGAAAAARTLRKKLYKIKESHRLNGTSRPSYRVELALIATAWNAFRAGERPKKIEPTLDENERIIIPEFDGIDSAKLPNFIA